TSEKSSGSVCERSRIEVDVDRVDLAIVHVMPLCNWSGAHRREHVVERRHVLTIDHDLTLLYALDGRRERAKGLHQVIGVVEGIKWPFEPQVTLNQPARGRHIATAECGKILRHNLGGSADSFDHGAHHGPSRCVLLCSSDHITCPCVSRVVAMAAERAILASS